MNEIQLKKHPGFNIWQNIAFTRADWPRMFLMMEFVFDLPGKAFLASYYTCQANKRTRTDLLLW